MQFRKLPLPTCSVLCLGPMSDSTALSTSMTIKDKVMAHDPRQARETQDKNF